MLSMYQYIIILMAEQQSIVGLSYTLCIHSSIYGCSYCFRLGAVMHSTMSNLMQTSGFISLEYNSSGMAGSCNHYIQYFVGLLICFPKYYTILHFHQLHGRIVTFLNRNSKTCFTIVLKTKQGNIFKIVRVVWAQ